MFNLIEFQELDTLKKEFNEQTTKLNVLKAFQVDYVNKESNTQKVNLILNSIYFIFNLDCF